MSREDDDITTHTTGPDGDLREPVRQPYAAGFTDVTVTPTHQVAVGMHSAIIRAREPGGGR